MNHLNSTIEKAGKPAIEAAEKVAAHPWTERLARFGYATKGAVYMVIGVMATLAAIGAGGETTDHRQSTAAFVAKQKPTFVGR